MSFREFLIRRGGFTLTELLVVVAIVSVLATVAAMMFSKYMMKNYLAEIYNDARNVYVAAQAYLMINPGETVDSMDKLKAGGFQNSPNTIFLNGSMRAASGKIELYSSILNSYNMDNNAVVYYNGRLELPNSP